MYYLALEGSQDAAFTTPTALTIPVLGVSVYKAPLGEVSISWGYRQRHSTTWIRRMVIQCIRHKVTLDATNDYGDLMSLENVLYMPYIRIRRTGTSLPRTNGTNNFWTHTTTGLLSNGDGTENPFDVVRVSGPDISHDYSSGTDTITFTLEATEPLV